MLVEWYVVSYLGAATSTISLTISKAKISKPIRAKISAKSKFFGDLLNCPYCTSHWVAFILCTIYQTQFNLIDWFVSSMVIVTIASIFSGIVFSQISKIREE